MQWLILLLSALFPTPLLGDVTLPSLISDNMVLQSGGANVWGKADPGEEVTVAVAGTKVATEADTEGKWAVKLPVPTLTSGATFDLTVSGKNTVTVRNVVAGE